ncbi:MAG: hypothetical protein AAGA08_05845 [Pseudomonadota bacterium]
MPELFDLAGALNIPSRRAGDVIFVVSRRFGAKAIKFFQNLANVPHADKVHVAIVVDDCCIMEANKGKISQAIDFDGWLKARSDKDSYIVLRNPLPLTTETVEGVKDAAVYWSDQKYALSNAVMRKAMSPGLAICSSLVADILRKAGLLYRESDAPDDVVYPGHLYGILSKEKWLCVNFDETYTAAHPFPSCRMQTKLFQASSSASIKSIERVRASLEEKSRANVTSALEEYKLCEQKNLVSWVSGQTIRFGYPVLKKLELEARNSAAIQRVADSLTWREAEKESALDCGERLLIQTADFAEHVSLMASELMEKLSKRDTLDAATYVEDYCQLRLILFHMFGPREPESSAEENLKIRAKDEPTPKIGAIIASLLDTHERLKSFEDKWIASPATIDFMKVNDELIRSEMKLHDCFASVAIR